MSNSVSLTYWNAQLQMSQPRILRLCYTFTAAVTVTDVYKSPSLVGFTATPLSQALIDAYLGTTNEFLTAAFDATAMGADAFGGVVNMSGQCAEVYWMRAACESASNTRVARFVENASTLTSSSLTTEVAKGANGNIGFRVDFGNSPDLDALTAGTIEIDIAWRSV